MKNMPETPHNLPPLQDLQRTPTLGHAEVHHIGSSISRSNSPNIDFDTAAFMLMSNDNSASGISNIVADNTFLNSPKFQNSNSHSFGTNNNIQLNNELFHTISSVDPNMKLPSLHMNQASTPPPLSATTPTTSNFDFDLIGQMLMSPKTNQLIDSSLNANLPFADGLNNTLSREFPVSALNSPNINGWNFTTQSPQLPIYAPSPTNSIGLMSNMIPKSPVPLSSATIGVAPTAIGLGMIDHHPLPGYNSGLLSNTESMALESFLDSIANEGLKKEKKRKNEAKLKEEDPFSDQGLKIENKVEPSKRKKQKVKKAISKPIFQKNSKQKSVNNANFHDLEEKKMKSKKERQIAHNKTEQRRRNMIKAAFEKLHGMILNSQFDLQVKVECDQFKKKRKRKPAAKPRTLKKYEVLQRSVREIQLLVQRNAELYKLLDETETIQKIDEIESDEFNNNNDETN